MSYQGVSLILDMIRLLAQALSKQRVYSLRRSEACRRNNRLTASLVSLHIRGTCLIEPKIVPHPYTHLIHFRANIGLLGTCV